MLLTAIQEHESSAARAAVFFASVPILMSQVLITVSGSSIAGGSKYFVFIAERTLLTCPVH